MILYVGPGLSLASIIIVIIILLLVLVSLGMVIFRPVKLFFQKIRERLHGRK